MDASGLEEGVSNELCIAEGLGLIDQIARLSPGTILVLTGGSPSSERTSLCWRKGPPIRD